MHLQTLWQREIFVLQTVISSRKEAHLCFGNVVLYKLQQHVFHLHCCSPVFSFLHQNHSHTLLKECLQMGLNLMISYDNIGTYCLGQRRTISKNQDKYRVFWTCLCYESSAQPYHSPSSYLGSPFLFSSS